MKLVQANIWGGKLDRQVTDFFKRQDPDFACLQEVNDLEGRSGTKRFATLDEIKTESGLHEAFMSPSYSFRFMERELHYGNAVLGKQPFVETKTVFTRGEHKRGFDVMHDDGNIRNLQIVTVAAGRQKLHILNHHGHHIPGSKAGNDETLRQMRIIAHVIDGLDGPIILCGDFNLAPDSASLALINDRLTNLSVEHHLNNTYNQLSENQVVCDYIFVNDQVRVQRFAMSEALISDHKALILEFEL
ncbi:MAG TPA: endonuclease/exonuclease/phosphatase family protein [Candidatus Saccharimonadales bacterium]